MVTWTKPTPELVNGIINDMRPADAREIWLSAGLTPHDAINLLVEQSTVSFVVVADHKPVYIFGGMAGSALNSEIGTCWGFGTGWLDTHGFTLVKCTKRCFNMLWESLPEVKTLHCRMWQNRHKSISWAKWAGACLNFNECVGGEKGGVFVPLTLSRR